VRLVWEMRFLVAGKVTNEGLVSSLPSPEVLSVRGSPDRCCHCTSGFGSMEEVFNSKSGGYWHVKLVNGRSTATSNIEQFVANRGWDEIREIWRS